MGGDLALRVLVCVASADPENRSPNRARVTVDGWVRWVGKVRAERSARYRDEDPQRERERERERGRGGARPQHNPGVD